MKNIVFFDILKTSEIYLSKQYVKIFKAYNEYSAIPHWFTPFVMSLNYT